MVSERVVGEICILCRNHLKKLKMSSFTYSTQRHIDIKIISIFYIFKKIRSI